MVFCFVQNFFFEQESWNIYFFCRTKHKFFFQNLTLGYMTKTLNQIIFFFSIKIRIFFSATLGIRIFFQKKPITPSLPLQVKWSFPNCFPMFSKSALFQRNIFLLVGLGLYAFVDHQNVMVAVSNWWQSFTSFNMSRMASEQEV